MVNAIQRCTLEPLNEAICLSVPHFRAPGLNVSQCQVDLVRVSVCPTQLAAVVRRNRVDLDVAIPIERGDIVVDHRNCAFGEFSDVQKAESVAAIGIDNSLHVDLADALELTNEECVLGQEFPWPAAFNVTLTKARVGLLNERDLLRSERNLLLRVLFLKPEQPVVRGLRMRLVDRREVFEPLDPIGLETAFVLVELGASHTSLVAGLADIAKDLSRLEHTETLMGDLEFRIHASPSLLQENFF